MISARPPCGSRSPFAPRPARRDLGPKVVDSNALRAAIDKGIHNAPRLKATAMPPVSLWYGSVPVAWITRLAMRCATWLCPPARVGRIFALSRTEKDQPVVVHRGHVVLAFARAAMVVFGGMVVIGVRGPVAAHAEDFDAGKSAVQLFASDCSSCHRTPSGLARRMNSWSLNSFLQEHYTASRASADTLSAYLLSKSGPTHDAPRKRSQLVPATASRKNRSTLLPPADIPGH